MCYYTLGELKQDVAVTEFETVDGYPDGWRACILGVKGMLYHN